MKRKKILERLIEVILISEKTQLPSLRKVNAKELKETVELVNRVIHNVITNSITEMKNLCAGAYVVAKKLGKMKVNKSNEKRKNHGGRGEFRQIFRSGEKLSVD